jgi:glycosyltransferase involved in cell wall biosynthesis
MKVKSVLILGTLPPPIGGVTMSVLNQVNAMRSLKLCVAVFPNGLLKRHDIAHAHNYAPWKRLVMLIIGKCLAKKNVFTIHGMHFKQELLLNRLNLWLADGVVIQNDNVLVSAPKLKNKPLLKIGSLVKEGIKTSKDTKKILGTQSKPRLLVYAQHAEQYEGVDIYGVPFIVGMLEQLAGEYTVVLADVTNAYKDLIGYSECDLIRLDRAVDFTQLLSEVDVYVRPTSKDGDSVAVLEAIMLGVPVVASDVTERRKEVVLYKYGSKSSLLRALDKVKGIKHKELPAELPSAEQYLTFYDALLGNK